jgi:subtilase family serine protease
MRVTHMFSDKWFVVTVLFGSLGALNLPAQVNSAPPRITQPVNDSNLVVLHRNVHPLARPEYDRGLAPASLPMERMMLLLKRSPQQEAALEALLAQQQDRNSPNYHRWLTPAQFGADFGPSDQDIQTIETWLESQGFSIDRVSNGRTVIEFSGSAGEVQNAFHTQIHRYVLPSGVQHWANSNDPEIPAALAPVVAGIRSLDNFYPKPLSRIVSVVRAPRPSSQTKPQPMFTFQATSACSAPQSFGEAPAGDICFMIAPSDFATIYNVVGLWNAGIDGSGQTIAIANDSNINLSDVSSFRSLMGLPAKSPRVILADGIDPGVRASGDESEAVLDVEWSGAVANNLAPILSYSFGAPEQCATGGVGGFYGPLWQQAAAEGITVLVASGDNGSAGCDVASPNGPAVQPATHGLQVNGLASPPNDVAVGGTDFDDVSNPGSYWNTSNSTSTSQSSAKGYVPETAWNETCTNAAFSTAPLNAQFGNTQEAACNNATLGSNGFIVPSGSSGGVSATYSKPAWQSGITPNDGKRDMPDISLFAGTGAISASFYYLCQSDLSNPPQTCSLSGTINGVGGTSVSAQVMAGIVALIDQKAGGPQGNINPALYGLAGASTCASAANPSVSCIFYDTTTGTNAMPCLTGSTNCTTATSGDANGILESGGNLAYNAGTGYDLATGLGSINAANLANASAWVGPSGAPDFSITSSNPTVTLDSNGKGTMSIIITPQNGFSGSVNLSCPGLPIGDICSFSPASPVTINGTTSITLTITGTIASAPGTLDHPAGPSVWPRRSEIALAFACFAALLLFGLRARRHRWNLALALLAFSFCVVAGCSGGGASSSSNGMGAGGGSPSGSPFTTSVTATTCANGAGCASGITHPLVFTVQ